MPTLPQGQFDHSQHKDMRDFTPIPPGKYIAQAVRSELTDTATGGQMLVFDLEILAGPYTGKIVTTRLNLINANPTAVRIAEEELATMTRACRLGPITASEQLHNIPMVVTAGLQPAQGKYGPSNTITMYSSAEGVTEIPINPEPDETTLAIMHATPPGETATKEDSSGTVPTPPAGFTPQPPATTQPAAQPPTQPPATAVPAFTPPVAPAGAPAGVPSPPATPAVPAPPAGTPAAPAPATQATPPWGNPPGSNTPPGTWQDTPSRPAEPAAQGQADPPW